MCTCLIPSPQPQPPPLGLPVLQYGDGRNGRRHIGKRKPWGQGCHEWDAVNLPGQLQNFVVYCGSFLEPTFL